MASFQVTYETSEGEFVTSTFENGKLISTTVKGGRRVASKEMKHLDKFKIKHADGSSELKIFDARKNEIVGIQIKNGEPQFNVTNIVTSATTTNIAAENISHQIRREAAAFAKEALEATPAPITEQKHTQFTPGQKEIKHTTTVEQKHASTPQVSTWDKEKFLELAELSAGEAAKFSSTLNGPQVQYLQKMVVNDLSGIKETAPSKEAYIKNLDTVALNTEEYTKFLNAKKLGASVQKTSVEACTAELVRFEKAKIQQQEYVPAPRPHVVDQLLPPLQPVIDIDHIVSNPPARQAIATQYADILQKLSGSNIKKEYLSVDQKYLSTLDVNDQKAIARTMLESLKKFGGKEDQVAGDRKLARKLSQEQIDHDIAQKLQAIENRQAHAHGATPTPAMSGGASRKIEDILNPGSPAPRIGGRSSS